MENIVEPSIYVVENVSPTFKVMYGIRKIVYSGRTRYQKVDIVETEDYGLALLLDGLMQSSQIDERIYHECLVHPTLATHPRPRRILVVGGGEGSTIREIEKHDVVEEITMVDLDGELIELVKKYIPWSTKAFQDRRLKLYINEGRRFLEEQTNSRYDIIVMDVTDPVTGGPAEKLYTLEFYQLAYRKLSDDGMIVTQASSISHTPCTFLSIVKTLSQVFPKTCYYGCYVKSFSSMWGFAVGSKNMLPIDLGAGEIDKVLRERNVGDIIFYSGDTHTAIFKLADVYIRFYRGEARILRDQNSV
ncbi:MAG: fused MFS/spermidine synthase [Nitrososphaerota archaeon]